MTDRELSDRVVVTDRIDKLRLQGRAKEFEIKKLPDKFVYSYTFWVYDWKETTRKRRYKR